MSELQGGQTAVGVVVATRFTAIVANASLPTATLTVPNSPEEGPHAPAEIVIDNPLCLALPRPQQRGHFHVGTMRCRTEVRLKLPLLFHYYSHALEAISRARISVIRVESEHGCRGHLTALPVLVKKVLRYLGLSEEVYTRLVINSS